MATNSQQMQAQADMARAQQGPAQPYMPTATSGGGAGRGTSNMAAMKKGGKVKTKCYAKGGSVRTSASSRGDGCATKGHTRGTMR